MRNHHTKSLVGFTTRHIVQVGLSKSVYYSVCSIQVVTPHADKITFWDNVLPKIYREFVKLYSLSWSKKYDRIQINAFIYAAPFCPRISRRFGVNTDVALECTVVGHVLPSNNLKNSKKNPLFSGWFDWKTKLSELCCNPLCGCRWHSLYRESRYVFLFSISPYCSFSLISSVARFPFHRIQNVKHDRIELNNVEIIRNNWFRWKFISIEFIERKKKPSHKS